MGGARGPRAGPAQRGAPGRGRRGLWERGGLGAATSDALGSTRVHSAWSAWLGLSRFGSPPLCSAPLGCTRLGSGALGSGALGSARLRSGPPTPQAGKRGRRAAAQGFLGSLCARSRRGRPLLAGRAAGPRARGPCCATCPHQLQPGPLHGRGGAKDQLWKPGLGQARWWHRVWSSLSMCGRAPGPRHACTHAPDLAGFA